MRAEHGTLWVTVDGRLEDIVLEPGSSRVLDSPAPVIVAAIGGDAVLTARQTAVSTTPVAARQGWLRWLPAFGARPA